MPWPLKCKFCLVHKTHLSEIRAQHLMCNRGETFHLKGSEF